MEKPDPKKPPVFFFLKPTQKNLIKPTKKPVGYFSFEKWNKQDTSTGTCNFFQSKKTKSNENWRIWKKEKNKSNSLSQFWWLSSSALHNRYNLTNFSVFNQKISKAEALASKTVEILRKKRLWEPGYDVFVLWHQPKTSSCQLSYQCHSSSANCARELFKGSNRSASLLVCTRKRIADFLWVTSQVKQFLGHFGSCYLA